MFENILQSEEEPDFAKGLLAGIAGGLLASFIMEQFQAVWSGVAKKIERAGNDDDSPPARKGKKKTQPTTVKVAESIFENVFGKKIPKSKKELAGEAVHYAMGATSGAIYGAVSEVLPVATVGDGLVFGTTVWLLADEVSLPALGFSKPPKKIPWTIHCYALASHLVYGWITEIVRRAVRKAL